jgi:hypothetical protein
VTEIPIFAKILESAISVKREKPTKNKSGSAITENANRICHFFVYR